MNTSNVELLVQAFAGWGRNNPANMRDILHPDCELVVPDSTPYGGTLRGVDAVNCGDGLMSSPQRPRT